MLMRNIMRLWAAILLVAVSAYSGANGADRNEKVTAVVNGTIIDGRGGEPIPNGVILIQGERILTVGSKSQVTIPSGARRIDAEGGTILPGIINAHVHGGFLENNLKAWAAAGVTTVRDEGYQGAISLKDDLTRRDTLEMDPTYARLISAGQMITVPGGYGSLYVTSAEDARKKVSAELDQGVDNIKLSMEDGYAGKSDLPKLTTEELTAIIETAHARGARVSGHITQAAYLKLIVEAGVDDAAHLAYDSIPDETIRKMVAKDIYLIPTFTVFRNYGVPPDILVQNLTNFIHAGGKVALGNDYGGGPGNFELGIPMYEMEMMEKSGMTPMQILIASTRNAAHVIGLEDQIGTLEPGKIADLLIVDGNPLLDLQDLTRVRTVLHNGSVITGG
jgi:imidazolonepropionase-like amidohydrolase